MQTAESSVDDTLSTGEDLPTGEALSAAFVALKARLNDQTSLIEKKSDVIRLQQARIAVLEEQLRLNKIERFGASSESDPRQKNFFNEAELLGDETDEDDQKGKADADNKAKPTKKRGTRKGLNPNIPRVQERLLLSDEQRIGAVDTFFVTIKEELDITPAQVQVIEYMQEKAVYQDENGQRTVVAAERPAHPLGKSVASIALLSYIIIAKYCDGLPLYRLEGILKRYGGSINRSTMAGWLIRLSWQFQPVVNLLREVQLTADYLQGDETRLKVLKEHGMDPTGHKWIWVLRGGPPDKPVVLFHYDKSREGSVAAELLDGFEGRYYQCDGYSGQIAAVDGEKVTIIGCMDHSRCKFVKAEKALPKKSKKGTPAKCTVALSKINALYKLERDMDKLNLNNDQRKAYRLEHAKPRLDELHQWLVKNSTKVAKDTLTYKAIKYTLNQWERLTAYCDHGQLHISNVLAENAIRPFVIGRKAWLFSDTPKGATASASYYTLIETAKANGLDPYKYILHLCRHIANAKTVDDIEALLPWNVKDQLAR
jgi:transposase